MHLNCHTDYPRLAAIFAKNSIIDVNFKIPLIESIICIHLL